MAEVSEIEAGGEIRTVKDVTARQGVTANAAAIEGINEKIPTSASTSNKMATQNDIANVREQIENYTGETPTRITATIPNPGVGNLVFYYKLKRKLKFWLGGTIGTDNLLASFQLPEGETFNLSTWGTVLPVALRNQGTGVISGGIAIITKSGQTYSVYAYPYIAGQNEVRMLNVDITEFPTS